MRHLLWALPLICGAALIGCNSSSSTTSTPDGPAEKPLVEVIDYSVLEQAVTTSKGNVVIVDFWATWCPPCVKSFPHLVQINKKFKDQGLVCIAASLDDVDDKDAVEKFLEDQHANFKAVILKRSQATGVGMEKFFNYKGGIPHMVMFSRTGERVWDSSTNPLSDGALDQRIQQELSK